MTTPMLTVPSSSLHRAVVTAEVVTITPEVAAGMLQHNIVNRNLRRARVDLYAKAMLRGEWRLTGESVVLAADGRVLQGQHRLHASVQSGCSFDTILVRGVNPTSMLVMDSGMARTPGDAFSMAGIANASNFAAIAKNLVALDGGFPTDSRKIAMITRDELMESYARNANMIEAATEVTRSTYTALRHSRSGWASLAIQTLRTDSVDLTTEFFDGLGSGAGMRASDPRLALRSFATTARANRRVVPWAEIVAQGIKTWNKWVDGEPLVHLKPWRATHPFPTIKP